MTIPFRERLACTVLQAEEATGLSRNRNYELIKSGELDAIKDGKLRFIKIASLVKLLDERSPGQGSCWTTNNSTIASASLFGGRPNNHF